MDSESKTCYLQGRDTMQMDRILPSFRWQILPPSLENNALLINNLCQEVLRILKKLYFIAKRKIVAFLSIQANYW